MLPMARPQPMASTNCARARKISSKAEGASAARVLLAVVASVGDRPGLPVGLGAVGVVVGAVVDVDLGDAEFLGDGQGALVVAFDALGKRHGLDLGVAPLRDRLADRPLHV